MIQRALVVTLLAACLVLAGCTVTSAEKPAPVPAAGGMGGGMDSAASDSGGMVEGFVAAPANCALELGSGSRVSSEGVSVLRVVAPDEGWVVVGSALERGRVLGKTWVPKGESRNVLVRLSLADGPRATVALHVDRGSPRVYEFDALRPIRSPDAQLYVARTPVQSPVQLSSLGSEALANTALLQVKDQKAGAPSIRVAYVIMPGPSWISVTALNKDRPPTLLGRTWRAGGEFQEVVIPLDTPAVPGDVLVTLHKDAGIARRFDFSPSDPLESPDQPYRSAGELTIEQIALSDD